MSCVIMAQEGEHARHQGWLVAKMLGERCKTRQTKDRVPGLPEDRELNYRLTLQPLPGAGPIQHLYTYTAFIRIVSSFTMSTV